MLPSLIVLLDILYYAQCSFAALTVQRAVQRRDGWFEQLKDLSTYSNYTVGSSQLFLGDSTLHERQEVCNNVGYGKDTTMSYEGYPMQRTG